MTKYMGIIKKVVNLISMGKNSKEPKPIGVVTHFFGGIDVAIVKFNTKVEVGEEIRFKGATTDFSEKISSMQYDHKPISSAKKGQEVGIKISKKVREGDDVFLVE